MAIPNIPMVAIDIKTNAIPKPPRRSNRNAKTETQNPIPKAMARAM
jgi:hypothetical protein